MSDPRPPLKPLPYQPPPPATLTAADLERIRTVVHDELARALRNLNLAILPR